MNQDEINEAAIENEYKIEHNLDESGKAIHSHQEDIQLLAQAVLNEKTAPEILLYEQNLVFNLKDLVKQQQAFIDESQETVDDAFAATLYQVHPLLAPSCLNVF